ncbi:MAG TPA: UPF0182 family protein [Actinomycetota bacterium]|jgi:uncharacterized membrane protein (UPF0182 family)|nr:UPF0182 family protein [Actinomycetota bacterium]
MVTRIPQASAPRRRLLVGIIVFLAALALAFTALSGFFIDVLWFREVGYSQVFWSILGTKFTLGLLFGIAFFLLLYANLWIVRRITPRYQPLAPEQEIIERYRLQFEPYAWWLIPLFAAVIAFFVGLGVTGQWRTFLLWRNSSGITFEALQGVPPEPQFDRDAAFYVFSLPWLEFVQGWLFSALVGVLLISAVAHYLWGGIRPNAPAFAEKVTPQVKAHLSVLLGLIMLTKAWGYYLGQFDLLTSQRGVVAGASYTDVNAHLPALRILVFIALVCAILFLVNIRMRGWALPVIAVGLLVLVSIAAGAAYPSFVQRFSVNPQELQRERPFIERNIEATRRAFKLDQIESRQHPLVGGVTGEDVQANEATIQNIRLWRPEILRDNYAALQRIRAYYDFEDIDVDRYTIEGERRLVMVSAREIAQDQIPTGGTWQNRHLVYTHGFGAVASQVNTATSEGQPLFTLRDIPAVGEPLLEDNGQRIYYGEDEDVPFVVVNSGASELDYQGTPEDDQEQVTQNYEGEGGIPLGNVFQRALFAWRYRDVNLLISGLVEDQSRIMIYRDIHERVPKAAPFLQFDWDPYAAIVDGRLVWIWDAYTTTNEYPYSEPLPLDDVATQPDADVASFPSLSGDANYIRNSVKVVVDAYDGTTTYYISDESDPIIRVWQKAFPDLFKPFGDAPPELQEHFRYPENLFQVQAWRFTSYHVTDPNVFYNQGDFWDFPGDPAEASSDPEQAITAELPPMRPYYVLMKLPGETEETFSLILPFTPLDRQNMISWLAAKSDPGDDFGQMISYEFPSGRNVDGPTQVFARINADSEFATERTLLGQEGSRVRFGDFLVVPVEDSLLYVQPVYVQSNQANAIPELRRVIVVNGGSIGIGSSLENALADALGDAVPTPTPAPPDGDGDGGPPPTGTVDEQVQALLDEAANHFALADAALRDGDLATYQREVELAQAAIDEAQALLGGQAEMSPSPSP